ncbi:MAG: NFACT family protein [Candidatus Woesearchaeota archaeon]
MVNETSSALLHFQVRELNTLVGGKVEKIYQLGKDTIIFRIYKEGAKYNFRICAPSFVSLTSQEFNAPMLPPGFCMFLRKYLTNARIESLEQRGFERILTVKFSKKEGSYLLIVELFKPGNVVLCKKSEDNSLIVLNSFERQRFKDRVIQARKPYEFPPELINPLLTTEDELIKIVNDSDRSLVKTLAAKFGLGGVYAEELITIANLDKDAETISKTDTMKLMGAIKSFFSSEIEPFISNNNIFPTRMLTKSGDSVESISAGIDLLSPLIKEDAIKPAQKKKDKTASLVDIQEKMIKSFERKIEENQAKGEFVYSNYQDFQKLINDANKIRKEEGLDALERVMKSNKKFVSINKKDKSLTFKF